MEKIGDNYDYQIRQWCLDSAVSSAKKGTSAKNLINRARLFYGFVVQNGKSEIKSFSFSGKP